VSEGNVFARIEPDTKRKIIASLKRQGAYVAMVGDGVNDVPALKEANMAIAMNDGAQIAKDVADVVLLNNAMSTLPMAFEEGKIITQKIFGTAKLFLTKNFYTILAFIFIGYLTLPFPTNPIQISWLTFGIINGPTLLITFGLLRPAYIKDFVHGVMNYVITAIMVGALSSTILYAATYLYILGVGSADRIKEAVNTLYLWGAEIQHPENVVRAVARNETRSAFLLFMFLYGLIVFWNTHGIDVTQPKTLFTNYKITLIGLILIVVSIIPLYLIPGIFTYVSPRPEVWVIVIVMFIVATLGLAVLVKNNRLVRFMSLDRQAV
jgi:cation-transporting P-type ATPase E